MLRRTALTPAEKVGSSSLTGWHSQGQGGRGDQPSCPPQRTYEASSAPSTAAANKQGRELSREQLFSRSLSPPNSGLTRPAASAHVFQTQGVFQNNAELAASPELTLPTRCATLAVANSPFPGTHVKGKPSLSLTPSTHSATRSHHQYFQKSHDSSQTSIISQFTCPLQPLTTCSQHSNRRDPSCYMSRDITSLLKTLG